MPNHHLQTTVKAHLRAGSTGRGRACGMELERVVVLAGLHLCLKPLQLAAAVTCSVRGAVSSCSCLGPCSCLTHMMPGSCELLLVCFCGFREGCPSVAVFWAQRSLHQSIVSLFYVAGNTSLEKSIEGLSPKTRKNKNNALRWTKDLRSSEIVECVKRATLQL
jgi:hypothetical protein